MWYIYATVYYLVIKKNENAIYSNMAGPGDDHIKWNKPGGEMQISYISFICEI